MFQIIWGGIDFEIVILSANKSFYDEMKILEIQGIPRKNIIDGRVFKIHGLDFPRLLNEGVACGVLTKYDRGTFTFYDHQPSIYPRIYVGNDKQFTLRLGRKSYVSSRGDRTKIEAQFISEVNIGNFTAVAGT